MGVQLFCDESGINSTSDILAIGLISTSKAQRVELRKLIADARQLSGCHNEMHLKSMSKKRYDLYKRVILGSMDYLRFYVGVIHKENLNLSWFGKKKYISLNYFTKKVVCRFVNPGMNAVLFLDDKTREKRDNALEYLYREINFEKPYSLTAVESVDSKSNEFVQVCDLYTGLARIAYLRGVIIKKNVSWDFTPSNRKEELLCLFLDEFTSRSGMSQKKIGRVWVWQPKRLPGKR